MLSLLLSLALSQAPAEMLSQPQTATITRLDGTVVSCTARQVIEGSEARVGKWIIQPAPACDPYGFMALINRYRQSAGLNPLAYDPNLSAWASANNVAQTSRGLGHHVRAASNAWQNSGMGYVSVEHVFAGWRGSPGHNAAMLARVSSFGIHRLGNWWTANFR